MTGRAQSRRLADDRGTALAEAAIMTPLLFLLVFGIFEFGLLMRDNLTMANASQVAARTASTLGDDVDTDFAILRSVKDGSLAMPEDQIERIVVFNAGSVDGSVPPGCQAGIPSATPGAECNVYSVADLSRPVSDFGCQPTENLDRYYCPTDRSVAQTVASGGPPDYVGIFIEATHPWVTGLWGDSITITDQVIVRLEPQRS